MTHEKIFKALADANRLKILDNLCASDCACKVSDVACCCDVDLSVVSRHLKILKEAGIIDAKKSGKEVYYQVNRKKTADFLREIADRIEDKNCCKLSS